MKIIGSTCLFLLGILSGCRTAEVQTFTDPRFDIPRPVTYAWDPGGNLAQGVSPQNRAALQTELFRTINRELDTKDWTLVAAGSADVLVRYAVRAHTQRVVTRTVEGKSSFGGRSVVPVEEHTEREGELAIEVVHPEARVVMWRGTAVGRFDQPTNPDRAADIGSRAVRRILNQLP